MVLQTKSKDKNVSGETTNTSPAALPYLPALSNLGPICAPFTWSNARETANCREENTRSEEFPGSSEDSFLSTGFAASTIFLTVEISSAIPPAVNSGVASALDQRSPTQGRLNNLNVSVKEVSCVGLHTFSTCGESTRVIFFPFPHRNSESQKILEKQLLLVHVHWAHVELQICAIKTQKGFSMEKKHPSWFEKLSCTCKNMKSIILTMYLGVPDEMSDDYTSARLPSLCTGSPLLFAL